MAKRYRGEEVLDMMDRLDTSNDEDSSDDETIVGNIEMLALSSSDDNSSDEEMILSDSDDDDPGVDQPWKKVTGTAPDFAPRPFTVPDPGFQLRGANIPTNELGFFQQFFTDELFIHR